MEKDVSSKDQGFALPLISNFISTSPRYRPNHLQLLRVADISMIDWSRDESIVQIRASARDWLKCDKPQLISCLTS